MDSKGLKGFITLAVVNLILVRIWLALQARGAFTNFVILACLVSLDYVFMRAIKMSLSSEGILFVRHHVLLVGFVSMVFLGTMNSLLTIVVGKGKILPDYSNLVVGLILIPVIVSILRRMGADVQRNSAILKM
jgi:hypothetical protein